MFTGEAATYLGRSVKTLQRWDRESTLSPSARTKTGRRDEFLGLAAQKPDLKNQRRVLEDFAAARGLADVEWTEEVGGGLNFNRKRFLEGKLRSVTREINQCAHVRTN
jgi:predicted site-specific integrase-resolvase